MPFHFAEARANLLTTDAGDAVTGTAEYKVCAAQVEHLSEGVEVFRGTFMRDEAFGEEVVGSAAE